MMAPRPRMVISSFPSHPLVSGLPGIRFERSKGPWISEGVAPVGRRRMADWFPGVVCPVCHCAIWDHSSAPNKGEILARKQSEISGCAAIPKLESYPLVNCPPETPGRSSCSSSSSATCRLTPTFSISTLPTLPENNGRYFTEDENRNMSSGLTSIQMRFY